MIGIWLKKCWKFLVDLSAVIATLITVSQLAGPYATKVKELFHSNPPLSVLFTLCGIFALVFVIFLFRERFLKIKKNLETEIVNEKIKKVTESTAPFDFKQALLPDQTFKIVRMLGVEESIEWSKDAKLASFSFYVKREQSGRADLRVQMYFYSEWKNEELTLYHPRYPDPDYRRAMYYKEELTKSFFEIPKWREAVLKAYEKINTQLPLVFKLQISSSGTSVGINFNYSIGKVEEVIDFTFDGKYLSCRRDSSRVLI